MLPAATLRLEISMSTHHNNADLQRRFDSWMSQQRYTPATRLRYNKAVQQFCSFLRGRRLKSVAPFDINDFLAATVQVPPRASESSSKLAALRCFFRFLYVSGAVNTVAPWFVRVRRPVFKLPTVLTEIEVRKLLKAANGVRNKAIIELLYATGCRLSELVGIKIEHIDFQHRTIRVFAKRKHRIVHFGAAGHRALRRYLGNRKNGPLFLDNLQQQKGRLRCTTSGWEVCWKRYPERRMGTFNIGQPSRMSRREASAKARQFLKTLDLHRPEAALGPNGIEKVVRVAGRQAGIRRVVTPQILRHTFATHMLQRGADIRIIQELLGHTWITSTQRYAHVSTRRARLEYIRYHPSSGLVSKAEMKKRYEFSQR